MLLIPLPERNLFWALRIFRVSYYGRVPFYQCYIPQGTKIAQAYLLFTVDGPYNNPVTVKFFGDAADNSLSFYGNYFSFPEQRSPLTTASTTWDIPATDQWSVGQTRQSPDLTQVIQEIVNRSGWASGNALSLIAKTTAASGNSHRRVIAIERGEYLGLTVGVAKYAFAGSSPWFKVVGVSTLFGFVELNFKHSADPAIWMGTIEFRFF